TLEPVPHRRVAAGTNVAELMEQVADAMHMTMDDYYGGRQRHFADLRCMACYLIKLLHPDIPLAETGDAMGIDHTSVLYHIKRAKSYLQTKEPLFTKKYETVIKTLNNG